MNTLHDVAVMAAVWVIAMAVFLIACQLLINHELRCRENAIAILELFDKMRTRDLYRTVFFIFDLTANQKRDLINLKPFRVAKSVLAPYFPDRIKGNAGELVELPFDFLVDLRHAAVTTLNHIESISLAYKYGTADRNILKEALFNAFITENRLGKWNDVMNAWGDQSWPVVRELPQLIKPVKDNSRIYPAQSIFQMVLKLVSRLYKPIGA